MKYINPNILTNGSGEVNGQPVGWILLGTPTVTGDYPLSISIDDRTAQLFTNDSGEYYFKNYNIAGISEITSSLTALTHTTESITSNLVLNISVSGTTKVFPTEHLDSVIALSNGFNIENGILVLAKYKTDTTFNTLQTAVGSYYSDATKNSVTYQQQNENADNDTYFSTYIDKILLAYTVGWTGLISNYNYSGFAAGKVVLTLSDLNS